MNKNILFSLLIMSFGASFAAESSARLREREKHLSSEIHDLVLAIGESPQLKDFEDPEQRSFVICLQGRLAGLCREREVVRSTLRAADGLASLDK